MSASNIVKSPSAPPKLQPVPVHRNLLGGSARKGQLNKVQTEQKKQLKRLFEEAWLVEEQKRGQKVVNKSHRQLPEDAQVTVGAFMRVVTEHIAQAVQEGKPSSLVFQGQAVNLFNADIFHQHDHDQSTPGDTLSWRQFKDNILYPYFTLKNGELKDVAEELTLVKNIEEVFKDLHKEKGDKPILYKDVRQKLVKLHTFAPNHPFWKNAFFQEPVASTEVSKSLFLEAVGLQGVTAGEIEALHDRLLHDGPIEGKFVKEVSFVLPSGPERKAELKTGGLLLPPPPLSPGIAEPSKAVPDLSNPTVKVLAELQTARYLSERSWTVIAKVKEQLDENASLRELIVALETEFKKEINALIIKADHLEATQKAQAEKRKVPLTEDEAQLQSKQLQAERNEIKFIEQDRDQVLARVTVAFRASLKAQEDDQVLTSAALEGAAKSLSSARFDVAVLRSGEDSTLEKEHFQANVFERTPHFLSYAHELGPITTQTPEETGTLHALLAAKQWQLAVSSKQPAPALALASLRDLVSKQGEAAAVEDVLQALQRVGVLTQVDYERQQREGIRAVNAQLRLDSKQNAIDGYLRIRDLTNFKVAFQRYGPVLVVLPVRNPALPQRFWVGTSAPAPLQYHSVLAVGYNDESSTVLLRNSLGATYGRLGHISISYQDLFNPTNGIWVIALIDGQSRAPKPDVVEVDIFQIAPAVAHFVIQDPKDSIIRKLKAENNLLRGKKEALK